MERFTEWKNHRSPDKILSEIQWSRENKMHSGKTIQKSRTNEKKKEFQRKHGKYKHRPLIP